MNIGDRAALALTDIAFATASDRECALNQVEAEMDKLKRETQDREQVEIECLKSRVAELEQLLGFRKADTTDDKGLDRSIKELNDNIKKLKLINRSQTESIEDRDIKIAGLQAQLDCCRVMIRAQRSNNRDLIEEIERLDRDRS